MLYNKIRKQKLRYPIICAYFSWGYFQNIFYIKQIFLSNVHTLKNIKKNWLHQKLNISNSLIAHSFDVQWNLYVKSKCNQIV